ncbi:hypothetical protein [Mesorhizobium sp. B2-8-3]|uniref:hypothetical protein n=1 Tax=Mesorhizobium sp. B2-8-3 TaxID=2589905 RepID=UPI001129C27E|nr:hypothetical protein [Mesorhizobium sp. B2-8-3]TPJ33659.1 hypothetical protein FJ418_13600 [Mesorhizobium sp. B2-8-3]
MNDKLQKEIEEVRKEVHVLGVRLTLAQAWVGFLNFAYDALLHHGVNYRSLKEYTNSTELDDAQKLPVSAARDKIVGWLGGLQSAIHAAVRRKQFKVHTHDPS